MKKRGIYFVRFIGESIEDNKKKPGWLTLTKGCCKFGQSLNLDDVYDRYNKHLDNQCEIIQLAEIYDRDIIDSVEKALHHHFDDKRLINSNGRKSEWMSPLDHTVLNEAVAEVFKKVFKIKTI